MTRILTNSKGQKITGWTCMGIQQHITFRMGQEDARSLRALADQRGLSRSGLIKIAIQEFLEREKLCA